MSWNYGQQGPRQPGRPIAVATDQIVENVEIVLPPGRVRLWRDRRRTRRTGAGRTCAGASAGLHRGRMTAVPVALERPTDDRGRYRIWGLQPGSYLVAASLDGLVPSAKGQPTDIRHDLLSRHADGRIGLADRRSRRRHGESDVYAAWPDRGSWPRARRRRTAGQRNRTADRESSIGRRLRCAAFDERRNGRLVHLPECSAWRIRRAGARRRPGPDWSVRHSGAAGRHTSRPASRCRRRTERLSRDGSCSRARTSKHADDLSVGWDEHQRRLCARRVPLPNRNCRTRRPVARAALGGRHHRQRVLHHEPVRSDRVCAAARSGRWLVSEVVDDQRNRHRGQRIRFRGAPGDD